MPLLLLWLVDPSLPGHPAGLSQVEAGAPGRLGAIALAYGLGGAAVGWIFAHKHRVWAVLLGYLPLRLLESAAGPAALAALWMGLVAEQVARWRQRRELLL